MNRIKVTTKEQEYGVYIREDIFCQIQSYLEEHFPKYTRVMVTDEHVYRLFGTNLKRLCKSIYRIPAGEASKSREEKAAVEDWMLQKKCGRDTLMLAAGGGVVGDLAGFVAATYTRGIPLIHIPTTLLAMVDSSIGGKTGINVQGKNMIGAIHQPSAVFTDIGFLKTLQENEIRSALSEIVKHAVILDEDLFSYLENNLSRIFNKDLEVMLPLVKKNVLIKASVVAKDEKEQEYRKLLNFGHTIGHAIESLSCYNLSHGEAIARGMIIEAMLALHLGHVEKDAVSRIGALLSQIHADLSLPEGCDAAAIIESMQTDKKTRRGKPSFILIEKIGRVKHDNKRYAFSVPDNIIKRSIGVYQNRYRD